MIKVIQIPALTDNYIHILRNSSGQTIVVDPSLEEPVNQFFKKKKWSLNFIFNTHHHHDHVGGNTSLKKIWNCSIVGFVKDAHRIPNIDETVQENQIFHDCKILFIPGHTLGHIAFWFQKENLLFCGDTLFGMGCGRLFEGTSGQMLDSLKTLSVLPKKTQIYCGHEYTLKNGEFALELEGNNPHLKTRMKTVIQKRKQNKSTVPFTLEEELKTNPFLRCHLWVKDPSQITHKELKKWIVHNHPTELSLFSKIRQMKDNY